MENAPALFDKISQFSLNVICDLVKNAYCKWGPAGCRQPGMIQQLVPFAELYFNYCAHWIEKRTDAYINNQFDAMAKIAPGTHPIDLLQFALVLTLDILGQVNISDIIADNLDNTIAAIRDRLRSMFVAKKYLAAQLKPCQHIHLPLKPGEKLFNIEQKPMIKTENGLRPLTFL